MPPGTVQSLQESTVEVRDVLCGILTSLSRIRGSQSYLFPALLQQSKEILSLEGLPQSLSEESLGLENVEEEEYV